MVLVNTLTVEAINTALIALQRGQSIVVGGEKGTTVNNITISNSGGGGSSGGSGLDFTPQISALDQRVGLLEKAEEVLRQENERQNERLEALEGLGIVDLSFEEDERNLSIELANGEVFETTITSEQFTMEVANGYLIITIGDQTHSVELPLDVQSDWTETDPDDPSFIKHKIPIWITDGIPEDNMSPVDSITDGEMRPPTSNAVYDKIASLDVASVGGSGKYIESISEVDGKIVAVEQNIADTVTANNMQSVSSNAVAQALGNYFNRQEQAWNTSHSYTLEVNASYILFLLSPYMLFSDIWFIKARHSSGLNGYWQSVMKGAYNPTYNISITGDTLSISGDSCQTCLVKINYAYA